MKVGTPVRVKVPGHRRLVRGVVQCQVCGPTVELWRVRVGLHSILAARGDITVIRRRGERELVAAKVEALRRQVAHLIAYRGNKIIARGC